MRLKLEDLDSKISIPELISELVPPYEFSKVSFHSYIPDPKFESQTDAQNKALLFAKEVSKRSSVSQGLYLDGGFGVGKTHLLASTYHSATVSKAFGPFLAFTSLIGYLGFQSALDELSKFRLICIDEFELDDPGDTMMMSRLLKELSLKGVSFAATSNTPPNALGAGRFASENFQREIQSVADRFEIVRIDGEDYRHRSSNYEFVGLPSDVSDLDSSKRLVVTSLRELLTFLGSIHQSRYAKVTEQFESLVVMDLFEIQDQFEGLRLVSFIDRCYERGIAFAFTGANPATLFREDHVAGAYQKKYLRCRSRLYAMNCLDL